MFGNLKDKVVLVTGSNIGIGAATVKLLSSLGCKVVVTGRNEQRINLVANECYELSPYKYKPLKVVADLTVEEQVKRLVEETIEHFGRIDVFVSNASVFREANILDSNVLNDFDVSTTANVRCVVHLCNLLLPYLVESKGCIVNVSASPINIYPVASMAKSSLDTLMRILALEFAPKGVRINTIHVGGTLTESVIGNPLFEESLDQFKELVALKRLAAPDEIANCIVFLASDLASHMTGVDFKCDGGLRLS